MFVCVFVFLFSSLSLNIFTHTKKNISHYNWVTKQDFEENILFSRKHSSLGERASISSIKKELKIRCLDLSHYT